MSDYPIGGKLTGEERARVEKILGHSFVDATLLDEAFAHASAVSDGIAPKNNERLEFVGDRVLGLVIAEALHERDLKAREGDLAKRLNALVRKESCTLVARKMGLNTFIRLGRSEPKGESMNPTIIGDVCEAVIAALYLDAGFSKAKSFVIEAWSDLMDGVIDAPKDPKTTLQEWSQGLGLGTPVYEVISRSGPDHAPSFKVSVSVKSRSSAEGEGRSIRLAEHEAAHRLLLSEKVWSDDR